MTPSELLEIERFVEERRARLEIEKAEVDRQTKVLNAKQEIFTEYDSLLNDLAK